MYIDHAFKERREVLIQRIGVIKKRMASGGKFGGRREGNREGTKEEMPPSLPTPPPEGCCDHNCWANSEIVLSSDHDLHWSLLLVYALWGLIYYDMCSPSENEYTMGFIRPKLFLVGRFFLLFESPYLLWDCSNCWSRHGLPGVLELGQGSGRS